GFAHIYCQRRDGQNLPKRRRGPSPLGRGSSGLRRCSAAEVSYGTHGKNFIIPRGGRSATRNFSCLPAPFITAFWAMYRLRTAPSIVAGQPLAVQSPARNKRGHAVSA